MCQVIRDIGTPELEQGAGGEEGRHDSAVCIRVIRNELGVSDQQADRLDFRDVDNPAGDRIVPAKGARVHLDVHGVDLVHVNGATLHR